MMQRKRFFSSSNAIGEGTSSGDLPLTNKPLPSPTSSTNLSSLRLAPGRSLSSSAALLRQRGSYSSSPPSPTKRTWSGGDVLPMMDSSYTSTMSDHSYKLMPTGNRSHQGDSPCFMKTVQALFAAGFVLLCVFGMYTHESNVELQYRLAQKDHQIDMHLEHSRALEKRVQQLKSETVKLTEQVEQLEEVPVQRGALEIQRKLFHLEHAQSMIHQGIQLGARRLVREKFGPGPHYYVELLLQGGFDPIVLETASLDDMPHSIYLFLEQVSNHLYDGTQFHRNAKHILQAGPSVNPEAHAKFRRHPSLMNVLFQEYSTEMPHKAYTVAYPGRPGGPDFYINLQDNTELHGPGGLSNQYGNNHSDADPCFAKVVLGKQVIDALHADSPVQPNGWQDAMLHPVTITRMRVLSKEEYEKRSPLPHRQEGDNMHQRQEKQSP